MHYVQNNFFAGETFIDLADCRARAETWCTDHGRHAHPRHDPVPTPRGVPDRGAAAAPAPCPARRSTRPKWSDPKVHRDFHVEVDKAIYSVPHHLVGRTLRARRDSATVKLYFRGELVKVHPRKPPGERSTDPADMPTGTEIYATRDIDRLGRMAAEHGEAIGVYAAAILDTPLPWTKMRQVYRLLGPGQEVGARARRRRPAGGRSTPRPST